jgi:WD40 repeat protein
VEVNPIRAAYAIADCVVGGDCAVVVVAVPDVEQDHTTRMGPATGVLLKLDGHEVNGLCWHSNVPVLASASFDKVALIWDTGHPEAHAAAALKGHTSSLTAITFLGKDGWLPSRSSAKSSFVVTSSAGKIAAVYSKDHDAARSKTGLPLFPCDKR